MPLNTPTGGDEDLKLIMGKLSDSQKDELLKLLQEDKYVRDSKNKIKSNLIFNKEGLIKDLEQNYIGREKNREFQDENGNIYIGEIINLRLPTIGKCKGLNLNLFISKRNIKKAQFEQSDEIIENSISSDDLENIYDTINAYFKEYKINLDDLEIRRLIYITILNSGLDCLRVKQKEFNNKIRVYSPAHNIFRISRPSRLLITI